MPVSLATDGNAPLAGAAAWSESSDQHPCPPLQEAQLLGAAPSGHGRERPRRLDAPGGALYCTACAKEGRPIAASHHPGESPKSALELEMRQILRSSEAVLEGGARARTCMCMCARHVNGDVAPRACTACCTAYRCAYVHVALHIHQASAPRRACATRAGSPRTSRSSSRPWRRRMRLCATCNMCMCMFSCARVAMLAHMHVHVHVHVM